MYNVVTSFGNYPVNIDFNVPGPYTAEELGLMWIKHVAKFSKSDMLSKYRLILMLPRKVVIPEEYNVYLDAWSDKRRFDENSGVVGWPLGPNLVFQQVLWLYHHKKMEGPFLWCEPDCIPVKPSWLDDLWEEYNQAGKPFMGGYVDVMNVNGQRIPRHMTGNGIYPDKPFMLAPALLEARMTAWDVFAAHQIMPNAHYTNQIQHEYRHDEIRTPEQMQEAVKPNTALFHTDKFGAIIRLLANGMRLPCDVPPLTEASNRGKTLMEVFGETSHRETAEQQTHWIDPAHHSPEEPEESLESMLIKIKELCEGNKVAKGMVARYLLENGVITQGHVTQHNLRKKKQREAPVVVEPT